jgi:hypothetical protein
MVGWRSSLFLGPNSAFHDGIVNEQTLLDWGKRGRIKCYLPIGHAELS